MPTPALISLLYMALEEEIGLIISVEDPLLLRQKLYAERRKDPIFECLSFAMSPTAPDTELWIIHGKIDDGEEI